MPRRGGERDGAADGAALWERFTAGKDDVLSYYRSLSAIFGVREPAGLAQELDRVVELDALAAWRGPGG